MAAPKITKLIGNFEQLFNEWKIFHAMIASDERSEEADFESLCVGWCIAKGLTVDYAYDFYQEMIKRECF